MVFDPIILPDPPKEAPEQATQPASQPSSAAPQPEPLRMPSRDSIRPTIPLIRALDALGYRTIADHIHDGGDLAVLIVQRKVLEHAKSPVIQVVEAERGS